MANISDAKGTLTLRGRWTSKDIEALSYVLHFHRYCGDYPMYFKETIDEIYTTLSSDLVISFYGCGRWSLFTNIERLFDWIKLERFDQFKELSAAKEHLSSYNKLSTYNKMIDRLKFKLTRNRIKLLWDYVDYEPGCELLCHACLLQVFKQEPDLNYTSVFIADYTVGPEATLKNYCALFEESIEDHVLDAVYSIFNVYSIAIDADKINELVKLISEDTDLYEIRVNPYYDSEEEMSESLVKLCREFFELDNQ